MKVSRIVSPYSKENNDGTILAPPCGSCTSTCCCSSAVGIPEIALLSMYKSTNTTEVVASTYPTSEEQIDPENTVLIQEPISPNVVSAFQIKGFAIGMAVVFLLLIIVQLPGNVVAIEFISIPLLISFVLGIFGYPILAYFKIDKSYTQGKRLTTSIGLFFKSLIFIIVGAIIQLFALGAVLSIF